MKVKIKIIVEKDKDTTNERIKNYFENMVRDAFQKGGKAEIEVEEIKNENKLE